MTNKNIVLITVDSLRYDHITKENTPQILKIAKKGALFNNCYSLASWTAPSFLGMFTSSYPLMFGGKLRIKKPRISVAKALKNENYRTAGFTFHPFLDGYFGYNKGFDEYFDKIDLNEKLTNQKLSDKIARFLLKITKDEKLYKRISYFYYLYSLKYKLSTNYKFYLPGNELNKKIIEWVQNNINNSPLFIWAHYMDVHFPYLPEHSSFSKNKVFALNLERERCFRGNKKMKPRPLKDLKTIYTEKVKDVDKYISELVKRLGTILGKNTIFVITADHGEEFGEHGEFHHELKLYDELIHVPLIIYDENIKLKNNNRLISHIDLAPTMIELAGIKKPKTWIGESLFKKKRKYVISEEGQKIRGEAHHKNFQLNLKEKSVSIRTKEYKYIFKNSNKNEIYNLDIDRNEKNNLFNKKKVPEKIKFILKNHLNRI